MPSSEDQRFPKRIRIVHRTDFDAVFQHGKLAADGQLVIHAIRSPIEMTRIGISVSKRVGNSPQRNRWKRLIREAFRKHRSELPERLQLVVRPKKDALPDYHRIVESLVRLTHRLDRKLP